MGKWGLLWAVALIAVMLAAPRALAADPNTRFGMVELVQGDVTVIKADGSSAVPKLGEYVYAGSTIVTGADGELQLTTEDSGYFALRANTRMRVDDYRAEGGDDDLLAVSLIKGTFRAISGWIGKFNRDSYTISTPTATIGIRGTDHEPSYITEEDAAASGEQPGTYDKVNDGASYIKTGDGLTEIAPNQSGYASARPGVQPRLLDHIPAFYRPTVNEGHILMRAQGLRMIMNQRYSARRQVWAQRHPEAAARGGRGYGQPRGAERGRGPQQGQRPGERQPPAGGRMQQPGAGQRQPGAPAGQYRPQQQGYPRPRPAPQPGTRREPQTQGQTRER